MDDKKERTIYCGNLSERVTEDLLYELFLQAGPLECVKIPKGRNYGFITFKHEVSVPYAVALMHGLSLFGKEMRLELRTGNASEHNPYFERIAEHKHSMNKGREVFPPNHSQTGDYLWSDNFRRNGPYPSSREENGYSLKDRYMDNPLTGRAFTNNGLYATPPHHMSTNSALFNASQMRLVQSAPMKMSMFTPLLNHGYSPYNNIRDNKTPVQWRDRSMRHH